MTNASNTIRVIIPLTIRKRNGRPKILPPAQLEAPQPRAQDPHVLRAIARVRAPGDRDHLFRLIATSRSD